MGRVYYVPDFSQKDNDGNVVVDGSSIYAFICDRRWFKIRDKALFMDEFYNASNRSWQQFLNVIKSFNYSLFANAYMLVGSIPTIDVVSMVVDKSSVSVKEGATAVVNITTTPFNANSTITVASSAEGKATATISGKTITITGVDDGSATITATAGSVTATISVTVTAATEPPTA